MQELRDKNNFASVTASNKQIKKALAPNSHLKTSLQTLGQHSGVKNNDLMHMRTIADSIVAGNANQQIITSSMASRTLATPHRQSDGIYSSYNITQNNPLETPAPSDDATLQFADFLKHGIKNAKMMNSKASNSIVKRKHPRHDERSPNLPSDRKKNQTTNFSGQKKLFAQEFYNLAKKKERRDLAEFSLHNHPDGYPHGIFSSNWKINDSKTGKHSRHDSMAPVSPPPVTHSVNKLRKLQYNGSQPQKITLKKQPIERIAEHEMLKYAIGQTINPALHTPNVNDSYNMESGGIDFSQSQDFLKFHTSTRDTLPKINQHELSQNGSYVAAMQSSSLMAQNAAKQQNQSTEQSLYQDYNPSLSQDEMSRQYRQNDGLFSAARKNLKLPLHSLKEQLYQRQSMPPDIRNHDQNFTVGENSNFYSEQGDSQDTQKKSHRNSRSNSGGRGIDSGVSQKSHPLKNLHLLRKQDQETRVYNDLKIFKSLQGQTYGTNNSGRPSKSTNPSGVNVSSTNLRGNKDMQLVANYFSKPKASQDGIKVLRHPNLKHELSNPTFNYSEQKLDMFAKHAPLFNQQAMSEEQIQIHEKIKDMAVPVIEPQSNLAASPRRLAQVLDKTELLQQMGHQKKESSTLKSRGSQDSSPRPTFENDLKTGVSNIKDQHGFELKVKNKLDEMMDPQNIQIFNVKRSKELYQVVKKQQDKEMEQKRKQELKKQKKNKPYVPLQSQIDKRKQEALGKKSARKSFKQELSPVRTPVRSVASRKSNQSLSTGSPARANGSVSPAQQKAKIRAAATQHPLQRKRRNMKDQGRPNYFAMKGRIDVNMLKEKLERDLTQNMKTAEKMGVFSILRDMHHDAQEKMSWRERHKERLYTTGEQPIAQINRSSPQRTSSEHHRNHGGAHTQGEDHNPLDSQFPGYPERLEQAENELAEHKLNQTRNERHRSSESIGLRSEFFIGEESKVDLFMIYKKLMHESIQQFNWDSLQEFVLKDEVVAFMSRIHDQYLKHDPSAITGQERDLSLYIQYLIGESNNQKFKLKREDFSQRHELNQKSLKMPFDEYAEQEENAMKTVANDIIQRVDYNTVVQNIDMPISIVKYQEDPKFAYFQICQKDSDLAIPLLAKVVNRQLSLMNYQLSQGHIRAFCQTFDFNKKFVNSFLFKNCGITDMHNEILLTSLEKLEKVHSLVYKSEEFGSRSVQAIKHLLLRPRPNHLQILRLIDCRMPPQVTRELISHIKEHNQLRVLGLVNANISHTSMEDIGIILAESKTIRELDISWNVLKPECYNTLITSLGENKTLLTLNLSWNRIVDSTETLFEEPVELPIAGSMTNSMSNTPRHTTPRNSLPTSEVIVEKPWYEKQMNFTELSTRVVENIIRLIKYNKQLQLVNLQKTGLTEYMLLKIGTALSRTKSLLSIHLCDNPGVTERLKDYLQTRIRCKPEEPIFKFPISEHISEITKQTARKILQRQLTFQVEASGEKPVARETIKLKQTLERKRVHSLVNEFGEEVGSDLRLIFTRVLGHKDDMPGSGQWKLIRDRTDDCWIYDQEKYGLIFWDPDHIAMKAILNTERHGKQEQTLRAVISRLHEVRSKEEEDRVAQSNPRSPIIMGDFTNWKPKTFKDMLEYSDSIIDQFDADRVLQLMQQDKVLPYRKNDTAMFSQKDWLNYRKYTAKYYEHHVPQNWKQVLQKHLLYKQPHLVNAADTREDFYKNLFMMAAMFKVGKHEFIIRQPEQIYDRETCEFVNSREECDEPHYMYYSDISDIRVEEVHPFLKLKNSNKLVRVFNKEKSVFAPWKQDTRKTIEAAFRIDWDNTKIHKLVKDSDMLDALYRYMEFNYDYLREIYIELQQNSVYPFVNKIELANFCEDSKLIDDRLNLANCDLLFVSSSVQQRGGIKQKTGLIRCEFLEYIVRLANFKYLQTGSVDNIVDAVKIVIDNYIKVNVTPPDWQQFRDDELWTIEVNDVFETNLDGLKKLHNFYFTPTQKYMSDKDGLTLLSKDALADLTYTQAKTCLAYCKMQLKDEITSFDQYYKLQPVEMYEMIGRAAKIKFANTDYEDEPLARRIEMILDELFPLIKFRRREVIRDAESESASDDEY